MAGLSAISKEKENPNILHIGIDIVVTSDVHSTNTYQAIMKKMPIHMTCIQIPTPPKKEQTKTMVYACSDFNFKYNK